MFLGLGRNHAVQLSNNKRDSTDASTTAEGLKECISRMRLCVVVATSASHLGRLEKRDSKGWRRAKLHLSPNTKVPITHVAREHNTERDEVLWLPRYDENAQELAEWEDVDQVVGAFLRAWSEILVGLRELEIMLANPSGPSRQMDIGSAETDMKRAEKVLGGSHPITLGLMDMSKERALIVHGDRDGSRDCGPKP